MLGDYLQAVRGIPALATVVLLIFFLLFLWIVWRAWRMGREEVEAASYLPLDRDIRQSHLERVSE